MTEPIRVLNLFTIMNRGGAETMVMNYYRNIDRNKIQFDFLVHRNEKGAYDDEIKSLGGRIYSMIPIYPQNFLTYKKMLREFFKEHKEYRIIHSHMSELGYFAFKEAKRQGIPIRICHAHNAPHGWDIKMIMRTYFKKKMMSYITHMFTCGKEAGKWLYGKNNLENVIMLNNAIDAKKFDYDACKAKYLKQMMGLENKFIIGHVGRFNKQKNHMFLLDIFNEIYKIDSSSVLLLAGMGEEENKIKEKVKLLKLNDSVKFLGVRNDIENLMQIFDVFLFPSLYEGLPVTMVEAQANGLKCFISNKVPKECIMSENVEILSLEDTAVKWAESINKYSEGYTRKNMLKSISDNGFDIEKNTKELEGVYFNEYKKSK